jgi:ABC-type antimicrobial peptide transport system permease subunit
MFYTSANILGLAFGLACAILILLWVDFQLSFDRFHKDYKRIFQAYEIQDYANGYKLYTYSTPGPFAAYIKQTFPEIESSARFTRTTAVLGIGDKAFRQKDIGFTDSTFFDVFTVDFVSGDPKTCLKNKNSIVLTEELAHKIFRSTDVIGQSVRINGVLEFTVSAIIKDHPKNSNIQFSCLIPFPSLTLFGGYNIEDWGWNSFSSFVKVYNPEKIKELEEKIRIEKERLQFSSRTNFYFIPFERVRLHNPDPNELSHIVLITIMLSLAGFVLLIASINFVNLITARSANRSKEVGVRKVMGSSRSQLITQYFIESFLTTLISLALAILIVDLVLPSFNTLLEVELSLNFLDFSFWWKILLVVLVVGVFSSIYPAFVLSSFQPAAVLKGTLRSGVRSAGFRKTMVVVQFTLTIFLVVLTFFMFEQLHYINTRDTGMVRENVTTLPFRYEMLKNYDSFINEVRRIPGVKFATGTGDLPTRLSSSTSNVTWSGIDTTQAFLFTFMYSDENMTDIMGIEMADGRFYSSQFPSDSACIVINEKAAKIIDKSPIVGEVITVWNRPRKIIGVMKDFNFNHFSGRIEPLFVWYSKSSINVILLKTDPEPYGDIRESIKKTFYEFYPEYPFESTLLEDQYQKMFSMEKGMSTIFTNFSILAIIISSMGLLSLAAYIAEQQRKSLVLRKIHGASVERILLILLSDSTKWVIVSGFIAIPLSYLVLKQMFKSYAYHANFSWWVFAGALGSALLIAAATVMYQAVKSARVNPAEILRYE